MSYVYSLLNQGALMGSVAAIQGLLVNRLGLAIASVPALLGLGAYLLASKDVGGAQVAFVLAGAILFGALMVWLSNRLRRDLYLLASLGLLECLAAIFGSAKILGGREGLQIHGSFIAPGGFVGDLERTALPWCLGCLALTLIWSRGLLMLPIGAAIDRIRETPETAARWFPAGRIRGMIVVQAFALAMAVGVIFAAYAEHVSPGVFSLNTALLILAFTVIAGRIPELAAIAAMTYWLLPYALAKLSLFEGRTAAEAVRIAFGAMLLMAVLIPAVIKQRRRSKLVGSCSSFEI